MSHTRTIATLVLSGATLGSCQSHIPATKPRPGREVTEKYMTKNRYDGRKSEERRREILQELKMVKNQVRRKAESFQVDRHTRITGYTAQQKVIVHCTKLMSRIAKEMV